MTPRRIHFAIDQRQDFFLSLAYARMLAERRGEQAFETVALILAGSMVDEYRPYLAGFDRVELLPGYHPPNRLRELVPILRRALAYRRAVRALGLGAADVVVGYSFRAIVLNAIARSAGEKPFLVRVRKCDHEQERLLTRRRPVVSAYWNVWNRAFGYSALRYRWLPSSNRHGTATYLRDPFDAEFCLDAGACTGESPAGRLPWPLAVLRRDRDPAQQATPAVVVLGERYPLVEGDDLERFRARFDEVLRFVRAVHPGHRLIFKPRSELSFIGQDLEGYEQGPTDAVLESLLLADPSIEKVLSFKSSGSLIAPQYGAVGYLLYPLCDLPADFRAHLDGYFLGARDSVVFVERLEDVVSAPAPAAVAGAARVREESQPLLDVLLRGRAA